MSFTNPIQDPIITASQPNTSADPTTFTFLSNIAAPSPNQFQQIVPDTTEIETALAAIVNLSQFRANLQATTPPFPPPVSSYPYNTIESPTAYQAVINFYPDQASVVNEFFNRFTLGPPSVVVTSINDFSFGFGPFELATSYGVTRSSNTYKYNNFPTTWQDFISLFQDFTSSGGPYNSSSPIFQAFFDNYLSAMGISKTGGNLTGDGSILAGFNPPVTLADLQNQFGSAFNYFLKNYTTLFPNSKGTAQQNSIANGLVQNNLGSKDQFLANWASYMTQTVALRSVTGGLLGLTSYQEIWEGSGLPASGFEAALQSFYKETLKNTGGGENASNRGFFIPSQALSSWTDFVQKQRDIAFTKSTVSLVGGRNVVVVNRILFLLGQLIGTLQTVSASQAAYLNFLTRWQTAYTNALADIPTFVPGDGTVLGGTPDKAKDGGLSQARNNISAKTQSLTQIVTSRQNAVGDQAKSIQSMINQSQSNSNQAVDMASAFLSALSTIVQSIFSKAA